LSTRQVWLIVETFPLLLPSNIDAPPWPLCFLLRRLITASNNIEVASASPRSIWDSILSLTEASPTLVSDIGSAGLAAADAGYSLIILKLIPSSFSAFQMRLA
jgi:hypothetical protein